MFCLSLMPQTKGKLTADIKDKKRESCKPSPKQTNKNPTQIPEKDRKKEWVKGAAKQLKQTNKQERAAVSVYLSIIG